jgi:hypothetical protein
VTLQGRAWCGSAPVEQVEVSVDGSWKAAVLDPPGEPYAWRRWTFEWDAAPGDHMLAVRATDADGNTQPDAAPWNHQGLGNNLQQSVEVFVAAAEPSP